MSIARGPTQAEIAVMEKELVEQGWAKQFTTFPDRLEEYVGLYTELGYQVHVEPGALISNHDPSCRACARTSLMRTIFIRPRAA